ncbi:alpha/beta fold hydrolase [Streptomyces sp. NPDC090499]|uniref:alpha/beta fold hydrolase n=1 Tax=Streptomyces sp. NPDC090499 TaxID=3365965 RepID=UPI0037F9494E
MTTLSRSPKGGLVKVADGVELHYETRGSGPDVVLLNNFFMDSSSWRAYTADLEESCRLIAYDLRGQGASVRTGGQVVWQDHVDDLAGLLDGLGVERAFLVGTSFSALLARDFALAHPDRVHGLILAGPALSPWGERRHRRIVRSWITALDGVGLAALYDQMYPLVAGDKAAEKAGTVGFLGRKQSFLSLNTPDEVRQGLEASLAAPADPQLLTQLHQPVQLFVGDDDFALGPSAVEELVKLLPDARAVVVPGAGHLPFLEYPDRFQHETAAFVARITEGDV